MSAPRVVSAAGRAACSDPAVPLRKLRQDVFQAELRDLVLPQTPRAPGSRRRRTRRGKRSSADCTEPRVRRVDRHAVGREIGATQPAAPGSGTRASRRARRAGRARPLRDLRVLPGRPAGHRDARGQGIVVRVQLRAGAASSCRATERPTTCSETTPTRADSRRRHAVGVSGSRAAASPFAVGFRAGERRSPDVPRGAGQGFQE